MPQRVLHRRLSSHFWRLRPCPARALAAVAPRVAWLRATVRPADVAAPRAGLDKYCVGCHNARVKTGGLALDQLDLSRLADHAEVPRKSH